MVTGTALKRTSSAYATRGSGARMHSATIQYSPLPHASPQTEAEVLAAVYAFVLECHTKRKVAESDDSEREEMITTTSQEPS